MPVLRLFVWCLFVLGLGVGNSVWAQDWKTSLNPQVAQSGRLMLFRVAGSNTIGSHLAPKLVETFFAHEGLTDVKTVSNGLDAVVVSGVWQQGVRPVELQVSIEAHGSATGFRGLINHTADLAAASRPIEGSEKLALSSLGDMQDSDHEHIIGIDGLAIIVNPTNSIASLNTSQIQALFTGKIRNWKQVGGADAGVNVYARDHNSGTFDTFQRLVLQEETLSGKAKRFESNDQLNQSVLGDAHGIGFVPLAFIGKAKALTVSDGVAMALKPSILTVATEDYPLSRRLFFYSPGADKRSPAVSAFLKFVTSDAGQKVVADIGFVAQALHPVAVQSMDSRLKGWRRLNLNFRFDDGTSELDNKAQVDIQRLALYMAKMGDRDHMLTLVGYSNPEQAVEQASLSRLRAQNVRWALREDKVHSNIDTLAGEAMAVADPHSVNADRNRRVEVWFR